MFFMMGIMPGRKDLPDSEMVICSHCGAYGRYAVFMTYTVLSLFFIPVLKWGRRYYVETSCCDTLYELNPVAGKALFRGEKSKIEPDDLTLVREGRGRYKRCASCGYETQEDFEFCPRCGRRF